jgi:hypothetical protein
MATIYVPPPKPPLHPLDLMFFIVMAVIAFGSLWMLAKTAIYFLNC